MKNIPSDFIEYMKDFAKQLWNTDPAVSSLGTLGTIKNKSFPTQKDILADLEAHCAWNSSLELNPFLPIIKDDDVLVSTVLDLPPNVYSPFQTKFPLGIYHDPKDNIPSFKGNGTSWYLSTYSTFVYYDLPLLTFLEIKKHHFPKKDTLSSLITSHHLTPGALSPDEFQQLLLKRVQKKELSNVPPFDVQFNPSTKNFSAHFLVPDFCFTARISAYCRFIANRNKKQMSKKDSNQIHTIQYQLRGLFYHPNFEENTGIQSDSTLIPQFPFSIEDAWFYEMCTGLSLTAEITALILELDMQKDKQTTSIWDMNRRDIFIDILKNYSDTLPPIPSVTWRYTFCRNAFREIDLICQNLFSIPKTFLENVFSADKEDFVLSDTKECYAIIANSVFRKLFWQECAILTHAFPKLSSQNLTVDFFFELSNRLLCSILLDRQREVVPCGDTDGQSNNNLPPDEYLTHLFSSVENIMIHLAPSLIRNSHESCSKIVPSPFFSFCCPKHTCITQILKKESEYRDQQIRTRSQSPLEKTFRDVPRALYPYGYYNFSV